MNMPGMTGEASVYKTNYHYRATTALVSFGDHTTVAPQGFWDCLGCIGYVGFVATVCTPLCAACLAGGAVPTLPLCAACLACVLGPGGVGTYITCRGCFTDIWGEIISVVDSLLSQGGGGGGGGGGGPRPCCPTHRPHCCGNCLPLPHGGGLYCDDACIDPVHQHCP
jgi:hypothetical protein